MSTRHTSVVLGPVVDHGVARAHWRTQSLNAQLTQLSRRVGKKSPLVDRQAPTAIINPWLADYRERLLKAQEDGAQNSKDLLAELEKYKRQLNKLTEAMDALSSEDDVARQRTIEELRKNLADEKGRTDNLVELLEKANADAVDAKADAADAQARADTLQKQLLNVEEELQRQKGLETLRQQELKKATDRVIELEAELASLLDNKAVGDKDLQQRIDQLTEELATARRVQQQALKTADEQKQALEKSEKVFEDQLKRNRDLLRDMQDQNAALAKEIQMLDALRDAKKDGFTSEMTQNPDRQQTGDL